MIINTGESCGEGSVQTLENRVGKNNLIYSCYDVFGDPTNASQWLELSECASGIISAVQQGTYTVYNFGRLYKWGWHGLYIIIIIENKMCNTFFFYRMTLCTNVCVCLIALICILIHQFHDICTINGTSM